MTAADQLLQEVIEWDIPNWSRALNYWEENTSHSWADMNALEIGSRHGGLSLGMALRGAQVVCTDITGPTGESFRKHARYQVMERIHYSLFSTFTYITLGFWGVLGRNAWQRRFMGLGDRMGIERLVPSDWRYLIVGLARK